MIACPSSSGPSTPSHCFLGNSSSSEHPSSHYPSQGRRMGQALLFHPDQLCMDTLIQGFGGGFRIGLQSQPSCRSSHDNMPSASQQAAVVDFFCGGFPNCTKCGNGQNAKRVYTRENGHKCKMGSYKLPGMDEEQTRCKRQELLLRTSSSAFTLMYSVIG